MGATTPVLEKDQVGGCIVPWRHPLLGTAVGWQDGHHLHGTFHTQTRPPPPLPPVQPTKNSKQPSNRHALCSGLYGGAVPCRTPHSRSPLPALACQLCQPPASAQRAHAMAPDRPSPYWQKHHGPEADMPFSTPANIIMVRENKRALSCDQFSCPPDHVFEPSFSCPLLS